MMVVTFTVFSVDSGVLTSCRPVPDYFHRVALQAYAVIRNGGNEVEQHRIVELATACLRILNFDESQFSTAQPVDREVVSLSEARRCQGEVEDLVAQLGRYDDDNNRHPWTDEVPDNEKVLPSQMMAAYAFHRIDVAAAAYLADVNELALQALAEAFETAHHYNFYDAYEGGVVDRDAKVRDDGAAGSVKRWKPMKEVQAHAVARWEAEQKHWKTKNKCAIGIEKDILVFAKSKGVTMSEDNARRTIYGWLLASGKRTG